jgi:hypothetical protein
MADLKQRAAELNDLKGIWGLLRQTANDIPFDIESEATQENILTELMACCTSGLSLILLDENKAIIGALLVRRDDFEWGFRNSDTIHVSYAAIAPSHRDLGVLASLLTEIQGRKVPVLASVKNGNLLGLADELKKLGFDLECTAAGGWGDLYKWQPPSPSN